MRTECRTLAPLGKRSNLENTFAHRNGVAGDHLECRRVAAAHAFAIYAHDLLSFASLPTYTNPFGRCNTGVTSSYRDCLEQIMRDSWRLHPYCSARTD